MYAVIEDSGSQFRVAEGDVIDIDLREVSGEGAKVVFDRVLLVRNDKDIKIGTPIVKGAKVSAEVVDPEAKGPKVHSYYLRRRKASRKKTGHRQKYLRVRITGIKA